MFTADGRMIVVWREGKERKSCFSGLVLLSLKREGIALQHIGPEA
jgi:hypothetical protein